MKRRGGIQLSFSMIFSIIIVIAILGTAFYVITFFLDLGECTEVGLFYNELQDEIDRAWRSEISRDNFEAALPSRIESVCFGDLKGQGSGEEFLELRKFRNSDSNMFLYPIDAACNQGRLKLEHVDFSELDEFTCFPNRGGTVEFGLKKESFDTNVKITTPR